jgi:tripartite-type tricarboxylate transporter receptor subunit TctC
MDHFMRCGNLVTLTIACALAVGSASAQDKSDTDAKTFPNRTIRIVVPFPAGGPADIVSRLLAQKMSEDWGQPVVVENRAGANTIIAAQAVAKAVPDGYTILMAIDSTLTMNPFLYRTLPYDPFADFAPITLTTKSMSLVAVRGAAPYRSVADIIAKAKAEPGKLNYGGGTITTQLMGHLVNKAAGVSIQYVPFKGTAETVNGLLTGSVDLVYAGTAVILPLAQGGKARLLAKMDSRALSSVPDLPTVAAATNLGDLDDISVWLGLVAPKATPQPIVDKIYHKVAQILTDPAVKDRFERSGNYVFTSTPAEFAAFMRKETDRWSKVLPETGIRFD